MQKYIWLVPLLPLIGAAINGLLGRKLRFSEQLIGGIAVGSVALSFLSSVGAVVSYGFGHSNYPKPYVTSQDGFGFTWIPGGAVSINQGAEAREQIELQRKVDEKVASMSPEELSQTHSVMVATTSETPRYALLDIEWSYQLDQLSAIFML